LAKAGKCFNGGGHSTLFQNTSKIASDHFRGLTRRGDKYPLLIGAAGSDKKDRCSRRCELLGGFEGYRNDLTTDWWVRRANDSPCGVSQGGGAEERRACSFVFMWRCDAAREGRGKGSDEEGSDAAPWKKPKITFRHFPRAPIMRRNWSPRLVTAADVTWT